MPSMSRRERAWLERRELILRTARELAESEGWGAVTTRRLAEEVDYSQPVLYGHFKNMNAIADAIAIDGIEELVELLHNARNAAADPESAVLALAETYLQYAYEHPAVYEAIFVRPTDINFASPDSPLLLKAAFTEIRSAVEPFAGDDDPETLTEVFWSALHGQATLNHAQRLRPTHRAARLTLLASRLSGNGQPPTAH